MNEGFCFHSPLVSNSASPSAAVLSMSDKMIMFSQQISVNNRQLIFNVNFLKGFEEWLDYWCEWFILIALMRVRNVWSVNVDTFTP